MRNRGIRLYRPVSLDKTVSLGILKIEGRCYRRSVQTHQLSIVDRLGSSRAVNTLLWSVSTPKGPDTSETGVPCTAVFSTSAPPPFDRNLRRWADRLYVTASFWNSSCQKGRFLSNDGVGARPNGRGGISAIFMAEFPPARQGEPKAPAPPG